MGVKCRKDVLYYLSGLAIRVATDICQKLAHEINMSAPTVDVDCSNVCFKVGRNAQSVANFLTKWANHGIHMNPVCDGKVRPIYKQATNERKANREKNCIKVHHLRTENCYHTIKIVVL